MKESNVTISVIIACYNISDRGYERLEMSLHSIANNSLIPEIVIADGSTRNNWQKVREISDKFPFCRHISDKQKDMNLSALWNYGMIHSNPKSSYFLITGVDFLYHPDYFFTLARNAGERSFVISPVRYLSRSQAVTRELIGAWDLPNSQIGNLKATGVDNWPDWCRANKADGVQFFPRKWFDISDGYDEHMAGLGGMDNSMHKRAKHAGMDVEWLEGEPMVLHQWHSGKYEGPKGRKLYAQSQKNWGRLKKTNSVSWKHV